MDDWSLLPSRNAESEPAPNPQSPMTSPTLPLPDSPARVKRPQPASITHARNTRRLTQPRSPGNHATNPGRSPGTPAITDLITFPPTNHDANVKNSHPTP